VDTPSWNEVLDLQPGVFDDEINLPSEIERITPFLKQNLPRELCTLVESTAYPFLSRHLSNSFGIWELPISPDSENLGSAMYPSGSFFNHSCDPNITKVRRGRSVIFVTSQDVSKGQELCISYGHTERQVEDRRQVLRDWWGFNCNCLRCTKELKVIASKHTQI
jgi:SET and MYND domain-containing protein